MIKSIFFLLLIMLLQLFGIAQSNNAYTNKGNEYYEQAQYELAEKQYRHAIRRSEQNHIVHYNLANALIRQKKYAEAEDILNKISESALDNILKSNAYYNLGVMHINQKNLEKGIEAYQRSLRLNPQDTQARENLQKALLELKQNQQQEKKDQQEKQKQQSKMNQKQADQKLKQLQDKEKQIQQRLQTLNSKKGNSMQKDW